MITPEQALQRCTYHGGWAGLCEQLAGKNGRCDKHRWLKCRCGEPASRDCDGFVQNFVCGTPLCASDGCKHDHSPRTGRSRA